MSRTPLRFGPPPTRQPLRRLLWLLATQALALLLVAGYLRTGGADAPDRGLQQLGLLMLDERVAGLAGTGRPALVVAAGVGGRCAQQVALASARRGRPGGVDLDYDLIVLDPSPAPRPHRRLDVRPDPQGRLARALALPMAATSCHPGYAVMAPDGRIRYRTYDPGWARHGGEQAVLLAAVS